MKSVDRNLGGRNSWNTGTGFKLKMSTHASSHFATTKVRLKPIFWNKSKKMKRKIQVHSETGLSKQYTDLEKRQNTAAKQKKGLENARRLIEECAVTEIVIEAARQAAATARAALHSHWTPRRNDALNAAVAALNKADTLRRGAPEKWREVNTRGATHFRKSEQLLELPSAKTVGKMTAFTRIFNVGFDKNGHVVECPNAVGGRWHGRAAKGGDEDAAWVAPFECSVTEWLGEGGLNWLATTSMTGAKDVVGTHALKAGVDSRGQNATTPEQRPLHADSCWPNSHVAAHAPWGDAHLVIITALQGGTRVPYYPFDKGGEREIVEMGAGDTVVFRGDLIHVGAEYRSLNIRLHCYIDSPCAPQARDNGATYHVLHDSWPIMQRAR